MSKPLALIVEDDHDLSTIFNQALKRAGCQTEIVNDGQAALDWLEHTVPDLVILDLHLPYVSGEDILLHIRNDKRLKNILVILSTADARLADTLRSKAELVLVKPVSFMQLQKLAKRLLLRRGK